MTYMKSFLKKYFEVFYEYLKSEKNFIKKKRKKKKKRRKEERKKEVSSSVSLKQIGVQTH